MNTQHAVDASAVTSRVERLRRRIIDAHQEVCVERARYLTESMKLHWEKPPLTRMSLALEHILNNISVIIRDDELVVGCRTSKLKGRRSSPKTVPLDRGGP
jgi:formate C-acetyltransferase